MTNDEEVITQETDTETTENTEVEAQEEVVVEEDSVEELKKRLATAEAQKEHWRKKAGEVKKAPESASTFSSADLLAVMNAKVHEDDMERVERFAKMEGVSIREALKNPELKAILDLRQEQRTTASAANVSNVRRGAVKTSDDALIANASAGKIPDNDEDIERLIAAKMKASR